MTGFAPVPRLTMGLRFRRSHRRRLRELVTWCESNELPGVDTSLFRTALASIEDGEPLVVHCDDPAEVQAMAALFRIHGIAPDVEELGGGV